MSFRYFIARKVELISLRFVVSGNIDYVKIYLLSSQIVFITIKSAVTVNGSSQPRK